MLAINSPDLIPKKLVFISLLFCQLQYSNFSYDYHVVNTVCLLQVWTSCFQRKKRGSMMFATTVPYFKKENA